MKTKKAILFLTALTISLVITAFAIQSATSDSNPSDLLVTQSYVDKEIADAKSEIRADAYDSVRKAVDEAISENYLTEIRAVAKDLILNDPEFRQKILAEIDGIDSVGYETINLKKGQRIVGTCEVILRSGKAVTVCPGENGISDLTAGTDVLSGKSVVQNHIMAIPRDDGRAIEATTGAYFMIRGSWRIK